ncbi:MAG: AMP-binding protein, partial [Acidimicrobiales bacterium]
MYPGAIAAEAPDKVAYLMAGSGEAVTYGQLDERSNRLAQVLRGRGLRAGDGVAILMENNARYLEVCWAAQRSGLYYTAISSRLTGPEVAYIVADCGAKALVSSRSMAGVAAEAAALCPEAGVRLMVGGAAEGFEAYEEVVAGAPAGPVDGETEGADMLYSSGTTGRPKGVKVALRGVPVGTPGPLFLLLTALYGVDRDSVYLSPAPQYHAAPLRFCMAATRAGATLVIMEHFDPEGFLACVQDHRVTHTQVVPTMFVRLLRLAPEVRAGYDLSSLRCVIHAAAPCPVPVKARMIEWWGPVLQEYYAGTEGNGLCAIDSEQWLAHPGSVGRPIIGAVHVADDEGKELGPGETGTVWFEGGSTFEYHNDPVKTAASRHPSGWTTIGDIGHLDDDGWLYLTDRKAFMIISGG